MICSKCKTELPEDCQFCPKCGKSISSKSNINKKIIVVLIIFVLLIIGILTYFLLSGKEETTNNMPTEINNTSSGSLELQEIEFPTSEPTTDPIISDLLATLSFDELHMFIGESQTISIDQRLGVVTWESSDNNIVIVQDGKIDAIAPGMAEISIIVQEQNFSIPVIVNSFSDMTLAVDCSKSIPLNDSITNVIWESSNPDIVTVENGTLTALSSGTTQITAYINEIPYTFEIVTTTPEINITSVRKIMGNTIQLVITGTNGEVTWRSDNTAIATVTETGLVTAEPTGCGQSTNVYATVDGKDLVCEITVEPIPQLESAYHIYGQGGAWGNTNIVGTIDICTIANSIEHHSVDESTGSISTTRESVLDVGTVDYSDGLTYPIYETYQQQITREDNYTHSSVYLVGSSQNANIMVKKIQENYSTNTFSYEDYDYVDVTYTPCDGYGIIDIWWRPDSSGYITNTAYVYLSIDGYVYQFAVENRGAYYTTDTLAHTDLIEQRTENEIIVDYGNVDYEYVQNNSSTFISGGWTDELGDKVLNAMEDELISIGVSLLFKAVFHI